MPGEKGLTDLGVGQQSQSSNATGGLAEQLGTSELMDEVGRSRTIETQLALAQGQQPRSPLDFLTSPRGLAAILASIGAISSGGTAGNVGIGALMGTLQQAQQVQESERTQKEKATEQLTKQWEQSQARQDKLRTRMANIYNTNPEAFQGPDGSAPDPQMLGFMLTGESNLPIWTSTRRNLNRRDKVWEARTEMLVNKLEEAPTKESARQLTEVVLRQLGDKNPKQETIDAIVSATGDPKMEDKLMEFYLKEFGMSGRDASIFALENGLSFKDPTVLKLLSKPEGTPAAEFTKAELERFQFIEDWETDPVNAEQVIRIRSGAKDANEGQRLVNEAAMASTEEYGGISVALINKKLGIKELSIEELQFQQILRGVQNRDTYMNALTEGKILDVLGTTKEEWKAMQLGVAQQEQADVKAGAQQSNARWTAGQIDHIRAELANSEMPGANSTWYATQADLVLAAAMKKVGIDVGSKEPIPPEKKERLRKEIQRQVGIAQAQIEAFKQRK